MGGLTVILLVFGLDLFTKKYMPPHAAPACPCIQSGFGPACHCAPMSGIPATGLHWWPGLKSCSTSCYRACI